MKKILILGLTIALLGLVGCGDGKEEAKDSSNDVVASQGMQEISKEDKANIKTKAEKVLEDKNVTNIDVLTDSVTGEAMLSIQLQGNIVKEDANIAELEELAKEIDSKVADISTKNTIEFIDKNYQLMLMYSEGEFTHFE